MGIMEMNSGAIVLALLLVYVGSRIQKLVQGKHAVGWLPGFTVPLQPIGFPGGALKTTWWNPGMEFLWKWRKSLYRDAGVETISVVPFIFGQPAIITSSIEVAKQLYVGLGKSGLGKMDPEKQGPLSFWGMNLILAEDDMWKRHRRIVSPSFSNGLYELAWSETIRVYSEMMGSEQFEDKKVVELPVLQSITFKFTLLIIGRCGFGFPFHWKDPIQSASCEMSFPQALRVYMRSLQLLHLPSWVMKVPLPAIRELRTCLAVIDSFMKRQIREKREEVRSNRGQHRENDIFTALVRANDGEADIKLKLSDSELISNIFLMLIAGHDTSAHTLASTIACLAKNQEFQQEVFEEIQTVLAGASEPTFDEYSKLGKVRAAFYEALRLFPVAYMSIRETHSDAILHIPDSKDGTRTRTIHVPKGTQTMVDNVGINYNPRHYENPEDFRPSRWQGSTNEPDLFYGFGAGPRTCIGRKFALSEAVCFLTMMLRDWKFEPLLKNNETVDAWFENLQLNARSLLTLAIGDVPIKMVRREPYT